METAALMMIIPLYVRSILCIVSFHGCFPVSRFHGSPSKNMRRLVGFPHPTSSLVDRRSVPWPLFWP
jgi:hypothetical protein